MNTITRRIKMLKKHLLTILLLTMMAPANAELSLQRATITVENLDLSLAFYTEVIGFTLSSSSAYNTPALRQMFFLEEGSDPQLVLLDASPDQRRSLALIAATGRAVDDVSNRKNAPALVINSAHLDELHARALAAGTGVLLAPTPLNDFSGNPFGREAAYVDPDGVRIVVFQYD